MKTWLACAAIAVIMGFVCKAGSMSVAQGSCRVYGNLHSMSGIRLFYEDGRYAYIVGDLKRRDSGSFVLRLHEDYSDRTGHWQVSHDGVESHEFWVHTGGHITPNPPPVDEHYSLNGSSLASTQTLRLQDSIAFLNRRLGSESLTLITRLDNLEHLQKMVLSDTCDHAKQQPDDVAREWLRFCGN